MDTIRISQSSLSKKLLITSLLCITGLIYLSLVVHIWIDTEFRPSLVAESYGYMEYIELTDHAHFYLPYYWLFIFAIPVGLFMLTQFSEKLKIFFAVWLCYCCYVFNHLFSFCIINYFTVFFMYF